MTQIIRNGGGGGGSSKDAMLKTVYDPNNIGKDAFNYENFINTPEIPAAQIQSDWTQSDNTKKDFIKNKPSIPTKTSDLNNDSGFITKDVNNLTNYTKTSDLPDFTTYQLKSNMVTSLSNPDNDHYPTAKAVKDAISASGGGDVSGPNSSTDGNVVLFDGATGKLIKDSGKAFTPAGIGALPDSTKYGASISVSVDTTDYKITTTLKDQDGNTLGTAQVIDLPLESVVVSGSYDSATKKVILTLENGNTVEFSVADLVSGLQSEITSSNKLDADLVDDSTSTNKFVTASDKTTWNGKQDTLIAGTNIQIAADGKTISATDTKYNAATSSDLGLVKLGSNTVQSVAANAVTGTASRTYAMQVNSSGQLVVNIPWTDTTYTASSFDIKDLADSTNLRTTWSGKQDALTTQTAYTTKGTSTKVATITTNTLGQVTAITETSIDFPVTSVNGQTGDVTVSGGHDYSRVTKSGNSIEIGLRTLVNIPTSDFTLTAPATLEDGMEYVIRITSEDSYTMTLGTGFTNPFNVSTVLSSYADDQFVFIAINGTLELQPLYITE